MIALNQKHFSRAISKARTVRPAVTHNGALYLVSRADGGEAVVRFTATRGGLWASCSCPAGAPAGRNLPLPCYHVAAAFLLASEKNSPEHKHKCPICREPTWHSCNCPTPSTPNYDCDCVGSLADGHRDSDYWQ